MASTVPAGSARLLTNLGRRRDDDYSSVPTYFGFTLVLPHIYFMINNALYSAPLNLRQNPPSLLLYVDAVLDSCRTAVGQLSLRLVPA